MKHPAASGCPSDTPTWLLAHIKQRTIRRHCIDCAMELMSTGKYLMLAFSKED